MEERLTIIKNLRDKRVTVMNNNTEIYGDFWNKMTFHLFFLRTEDTVLMGERFRTYNGF